MYGAVAGAPLRVPAPACNAPCLVSCPRRVIVCKQHYSCTRRVGGRLAARLLSVNMMPATSRVISMQKRRIAMCPDCSGPRCMAMLRHQKRVPCSFRALAAHGPHHRWLRHVRAQQRFWPVPIRRARRVPHYRAHATFGECAHLEGGVQASNDSRVLTDQAAGRLLGAAKATCRCCSGVPCAPFNLPG